MVELTKITAEAMKLPLLNALVWSGHCLNTKGHNVRYHCYREELFHASYEVTWAMRQHSPGVFVKGFL